MSDDVLELLEDDETLAQIAEEIRAKRVAAGLNPDTGQPASQL